MVVDRREEYMARWVAIFERYGIDYLEVRKELAAIKLGVPADVISNKVEPSSKKAIDEELEFDDNNF